MIVDYHMHLRGPSNGREGPVELSVDAVERFVEQAEFEASARSARAKGFLTVSASPLTRSSYHAGDDFQRLREARRAAAELSA